MKDWDEDREKSKKKSSEGHYNGKYFCIPKRHRYVMDTPNYNPNPIKVPLRNKYRPRRSPPVTYTTSSQESTDDKVYRTYKTSARPPDELFAPMREAMHRQQVFSFLRDPSNIASIESYTELFAAFFEHTNTQNAPQNLRNTYRMIFKNVLTYAKEHGITASQAARLKQKKNARELNSLTKDTPFDFNYNEFKIQLRQFQEWTEGTLGSPGITLRDFRRYGATGVEQLNRHFNTQAILVTDFIKKLFDGHTVLFTSTKPDYLTQNRSCSKPSSLKRPPYRKHFPRRNYSRLRRDQIKNDYFCVKERTWEPDGWPQKEAKKEPKKEYDKLNDSSTLTDKTDTDEKAQPKKEFKDAFKLKVNNTDKGNDKKIFEEDENEDFEFNFGKADRENDHEFPFKKVSSEDRGEWNRTTFRKREKSKLSYEEKEMDSEFKFEEQPKKEFKKFRKLDKISWTDKQINKQPEKEFKDAFKLKVNNANTENDQAEVLNLRWVRNEQNRRGLIDKLRKYLNGKKVDYRQFFENIIPLYKLWCEDNEKDAGKYAQLTRDILEPLLKGYHRLVKKFNSFWEHLSFLKENPDLKESFAVFLTHGSIRKYLTNFFAYRWKKGKGRLNPSWVRDTIKGWRDKLDRDLGIFGESEIGFSETKSLYHDIGDRMRAYRHDETYHKLISTLEKYHVLHLFLDCNLLPVLERAKASEEVKALYAQLYTQIKNDTSFQQFWKKAIKDKYLEIYTTELTAHDLQIGIRDLAQSVKGNLLEQKLKIEGMGIEVLKKGADTLSMNFRYLFKFGYTTTQFEKKLLEFLNSEKYDLTALQKETFRTKYLTLFTELKKKFQSLSPIPAFLKAMKAALKAQGRKRSVSYIKIETFLKKIY
ncbi:MAG: hypothetical protein R6U96_10575, partial [Promethearchaeia archaeon]